MVIYNWALKKWEFFCEIDLMSTTTKNGACERDLNNSSFNQRGLVAVWRALIPVRLAHRPYPL